MPTTGRCWSSPIASSRSSVSTPRSSPRSAIASAKRGTEPMRVGLVQDAGEMALRPATLVSDAFRQRAVLAETDHRPWELPRRPWFMGQSWIDLLFAHWPVPAEALRAVVPEQLPIDTRDGAAWLGITPFCVRGLRLRGTIPVPGLSTFPELN